MTAALRADSIGPVDVAVIAFEGNEFNGDVAPALAELHDSGTVRVIDLAFVRKEDDGSTSFVEVEDADVADAFARVNGEPFDLLSDEDLTEIASGLAGRLVGDGRGLGEQLGGAPGRSCPELQRLPDRAGENPSRERRAGHHSARRGLGDVMPRRRMGRPGLMGTMARTAVIAGTATAVSGSVSRHGQEKAAAQQQNEMAKQQAMTDQAAAQAAAQVQAQQAAAAAAAAPARPAPTTRSPRSGSWVS